jgi:hypothetical protein
MRPHSRALTALSHRPDRRHDRTPALADISLGQGDSLARAAATDVVVFNVVKVRPLDGGEVASCRVFGRAIRAERGKRFKPRQSVRLIVPCACRARTPRTRRPSGWTARPWCARPTAAPSWAATAG